MEGEGVLADWGEFAVGAGEGIPADMADDGACRFTGKGTGVSTAVAIACVVLCVIRFVPNEWISTGFRSFPTLYALVVRNDITSVVEGRVLSKSVVLVPSNDRPRMQVICRSAEASRVSRSKRSFSGQESRGLVTIVLVCLFEPNECNGPGKSDGNQNWPNGLKSDVKKETEEERITCTKPSKRLWTTRSGMAMEKDEGKG